MTQPHQIDREAVALWGCADGNGVDPRLVFRDRADALAAAAELGLTVQALYAAPEAVAWREALDQLCRASVDLDEAHDMIVEWSAYADEYFQQKHDLATDLARIKLAAGEARRKHLQALALIATHPVQGGDDR